MDRAGNLYGTTQFGGANGGGTVFELSPTGTETVLYSFGSQSGDGLNSRAGLVFDKKGNLYGTTINGGAYGQGTVFKLTPNGIETVLYSFGSQSGDGSNAYGGLVMDKKENLYGTTAYGAAYGGGTVFKLTPAGVETILHTFGSQPGDGLITSEVLVFDKKGDLCGTTESGGANGEGTAFKLAPTDLLLCLPSCRSRPDLCPAIEGDHQLASLH